MEERDLLLKYNLQWFAKRDLAAKRQSRQLQKN